MTKLGFRIVTAIAMVGAFAASAGAQTAEPSGNSCITSVFGGFDPVTEEFPLFADFNTCIASSLSLQRNIYVTEVVRRVTGASFGFAPSLVEPAGLAGIVAGDDGRLSPSGMTVVPMAGEAVASTKWNGWADGRYLYSDYAPSAGDFNGPTWSGMFGLDYKVTDKISLGFLGMVDGSQLDSPFGAFDSHSYGAGPYLGIVLNDHLVLSANVMGSRVVSSQFGGILEFQTGRVQAATSLTGYWYKDTLRFTPAVSLSVSRDWEHEASNLAVADRTLDLGLLTPSLQMGNTFRMSDTSTIEPWLGAALDWTFLNHIDDSGGPDKDDPTTDLRLQAGLNFTFGTNAQLALTAEASGLLLDEIDSYSIAANFAYQF